MIRRQLLVALISSVLLYSCLAPQGLVECQVIEGGCPRPDPNRLGWNHRIVKYRLPNQTDIASNGAIALQAIAVWGASVGVRVP